MMAPPATTRAKVLLVDDDPRMLRSMQMLLRDSFDVTTAASVDEAVKAFDATSFDVLLAGFGDDGRAGIEFLRNAKKQFPTAGRVLVSGSDDPAIMASAINDGEVHGFITKPWSNGEFLGAVRGAVERARALRPAHASPATAKTVSDPILLLPGNRTQAETISKMLKSTRHELVVMYSLSDTTDFLASNRAAMVIAPARFGTQSVNGVLEHLKSLQPDLKALVLVDPNRVPRPEIVELINASRVLRVVIEPVSAGLFRLAVQTAAAKAEATRHLEEIGTEMRGPSPKSDPSVRRNLKLARYIAQRKNRDN